MKKRNRRSNAAREAREARELRASKLLRHRMLATAARRMSTMSRPPGAGEVNYNGPLVGHRMHARVVALTDELRRAAVGDDEATARLLDSTTVFYVMIAADEDGRLSIGALPR
ncbi:MAG: hypothetical protein RLP09_50375, partial [Sandaracinaceae bacterium]